MTDTIQQINEGTSRRSFIKGVIASASVVSSSAYLFRGRGGSQAWAASSGAVERLISDNIIPQYIVDRYQKWDEELGKNIHSKMTGLDTLHQIVIENNLNPQAKSGQQEMLENILNKYL